MKFLIVGLIAAVLSVTGTMTLSGEAREYHRALNVEFEPIETVEGYWKESESPETAEISILSEFTAEVEEIVEETVNEPYIEENTAQTADWQFYGVCTITHYCPCEICNGGYTGTASGAPLTPYRTVACSGLPFGTEVLINGSIYVVEDRGGGVQGMHIDICVGSHEEAIQRGRYNAEVYVR